MDLGPTDVLVCTGSCQMVEASRVQQAPKQRGLRDTADRESQSNTQATGTGRQGTRALVRMIDFTQLCAAGLV